MLKDGENAKWCQGCNKLLPFTNYHKQKNGKYNLYTYCKSCRSEIYKVGVEFKKFLYKTTSINITNKVYLKETVNAKICGRCRKLRPYSDYNKNKSNKDNLAFTCKICFKQIRKATREQRHEYNKKWIKANKERSKEWHRKYANQKRKENEDYRLKSNLSKRIWKSLKGINKSTTTIKLIGCNIKELKCHLESQFTEGMSWDNYGDWHVDHIIPCDAFDLKDKKQQKECFHYTNLQPLWAEDNLKKSNKLNYEIQ